MKVTPTIIITIRSLRITEDVLQVWEGSQQRFFTLHPSIIYFWKPKKISS